MVEISVLCTYVCMCAGNRAADTVLRAGPGQHGGWSGPLQRTETAQEDCGGHHEEHPPHLQHQGKPYSGILYCLEEYCFRITQSVPRNG